MLTQLNIQGLAIIDKLSIEFSTGFNVITGETGAGKSILIKALGFLLGSKASSETVRSGRDMATVSGLFEVPITHVCRKVLEKYDILSDNIGDSFQLLVRRTINNRGRSLAWINDTPVTITVLKEIAHSLVDVFGQHENLRLLDSVEHTACLDQFLDDKELIGSYQDRYRKMLKRLQNLTALVDGYSAKQRDLDYLTFRCNELRTFGPDEADYHRVKEFCLRADHTLNLAKSLEVAQSLIDQGANGEPLSRPIWEINRVLNKILTVAPNLTPIADQAATVAAMVDDLSFQLGTSSSILELSDEDIEAAQTRLAGYQELFRKLNVNDVDSLVLEKQRLEDELSFLESASTDVFTQLRDLDDLVTELKDIATQLSAARQKAKATVKRRIEIELQELAMPGARIDIDFNPVKRPIIGEKINLFGPEAEKLWTGIAETLTSFGEQGAEKAQLLLAANPGEPFLPLQKIASGGEISRIMLALKKALAAGADTCILVFDEIDTGISGRVASVVGRKMQELADNFQVICISHLAQVAAHADTHFLVHKISRSNRTESTLSKLSSRASEEELARLLSGEELTPSSLANARALVKKARGRPNANK